jgi:site-specific DNA-methyltransferase (cytosine-N4-specific)
MPKQLTTHQIATDIRKRFSVVPPLLLASDSNSLTLELKPYLQPFEIELALRELRALVKSNVKFIEEYGYYHIKTDKPEGHFRDRLTYWQRVGRKMLEPTLQKTLEFTQTGLVNSQEKLSLHNARRLRYGPHDLHEYRGKFFPQLVRSLINISGVSDKAVVLDPFCGSGTTPCEVLASGRSALGIDLNPLSVLIASVKAAVVLENSDAFFDTVTGYLTKFTFKPTRLANHWNEDDIEYLARWFDSKAIEDVAAILSEIHTVIEPLYRDFFKVCLSNVIRSVSWQKDTDLRVRKEIRPYEAGSAVARFKDEIRQQCERIFSYLCVKPHLTPSPLLTIEQGNSVNVAASFEKYEGKVDLLITSPPYATALPYLDTDRLSLIVLGLLPRKEHKTTECLMVGTREVSERERREAWELYLKRKGELPDSVTTLIDHIASYNHGDSVGFRRRNLPALLGKYFLDMLDSMRSALKLMRPGARAYYVVGNNSTTLNDEKIEIPTNKFLFEIGAAAGWLAEEVIPMELLSSRDIFKENRGSEESILCFKVKSDVKKSNLH